MKILPNALLGILAATGLTLFAGVSPATAADFEMRYTDLGPNRGARAESLVWWADELNKRSDGRINVEFFWGQSLVKGKDTLKAVGSGLVETGTVLGIYTPGDLPVWNVSNTPFMFSDAWVATQTMMEARRTIPALQEETAKKGVKILVNNTTGPVQLLGAKGPLLSAGDLAGKKIRATGGWSSLMESLGASPVRINMGELYQALDRGTIDGSIIYTDLVQKYKFYEVATDVTETNMGQVLGFGVGINKDLFDSMPADLQDIVVAVSNETSERAARAIIEGQKTAKTALMAGIDGRVVNFHDFDDAERDAWKAKSDLSVEKWLSTMADKGVDGQAVLDEIYAIRATYRAELAEKGYPWAR